MPHITNLPDEVLCDVVSLAIQNWRSFPKVFKEGNNFKDCVALIDISRVCRRWREVALTNPSLWSSLFILLDDPTAETLHKVTYFVEICLERSKNLPLTIAVDILLDHTSIRSAHPLMIALAAHEVRWSQISIQFPRTRPRMQRYPSSARGNNKIILQNAGGGILKEFSFDVSQWLLYSMSDPLQGLETLRLRIGGLTTHPGQIATDLPVLEITKWVSLAPNLQELEVMSHVSDWDSDHQRGPRILLPKLQVLISTPHILRYLTCPTLEKYTMEHDPYDDAQTIFQHFVERSACPLHTLTVTNPCESLYPPMVRGYLIPRITSLVVISPADDVLAIIPPHGGEEYTDVLPSLEHLELHDFERFTVDELVFDLVTFRWDLGASNRTLKSVKLVRCFESIPEALFNPEGGIDLAVIDEKWQELARCVNEGLLLSR